MTEKAEKTPGSQDSTPSRTEHYNTKEASENDLKKIFMMMRQTVKYDMRKIT